MNITRYTVTAPTIWKRIDIPLLRHNDLICYNYSKEKCGLYSRVLIALTKELNSYCPSNISVSIVIELENVIFWTIVYYLYISASIPKNMWTTWNLYVPESRINVLVFLQMTAHFGRLIFTLTWAEKFMTWPGLGVYYKIHFYLPNSARVIFIPLIN